MTKGSEESCLHISTSTHPHKHGKSHTHQHYAAHTYKQGKVHAHSHYKAIFLYRGKINEYEVTRSSKIRTCAYMDSNSHIVVHTHRVIQVTYTYTGMPAHRIQRVWCMERNKQNRGDRGRWHKTHTITSAHTCIRVCAHMDTCQKHSICIRNITSSKDWQIDGDEQRWREWFISHLYEKTCLNKNLQILIKKLNFLPHFSHFYISVN